MTNQIEKIPTEQTGLNVAAAKIVEAMAEHRNLKAKTLEEVRDKLLYRPEFNTFAEYCEKVWGISKRHADRLIENKQKELPSREKFSKQHVYVIRCSVTGVLKIGVSIDPQRRMSTIQTGYPYPLELVQCFTPAHAVKTEKSLHESLDDFRLNGEWFDGYALQMVNWPAA